VLPDRAVSRRRFMRGAAFGAVLAASPALLAACSSTAPNDAPSSGGATVSTPPATSSPGPPSPGMTSAGVPLRARIASLLIVGFDGLHVDDAAAAPIRRAIGDDSVGGVILFDRDQQTGGPRNVESPTQVVQLTRDLQALAAERPGRRRLIVAIDQEGGRVTRLSPAHGFPAVASQADIGEAGERIVESWAAGLAATLAASGVNLNLAPVVDLDVNPTNPAIGALGRAFSADPAVVAGDAAIEIRAHRAAGIATTLKHFPGLGSAAVNTDFGVADVTATWTRTELDPYEELLEQGLVDVVMAAHLVNGRLDANAPASLSRATVTDLLRGELGWQGPVVTDDLQAAAITAAFGADDAVALALEAGNDLLLFANQHVDEPDVTRRVVDLVERLIHEGQLTEARIDASVARVDALINATG
jgi:beta-N-acetylhexosaminidase